MKQTSKRILSFVLSLCMLVSMMTVFTFAANNYVPDDEYYDRIMLDSVVVNEEWENVQKGDKVKYTFRGTEYEETYDKNTHFASVQEAFDASVKANNRNPVILLAAGTFTKSAVITDNVTIIGAKAGVDPNVKGKADTDVWTVNPERADSSEESIVKGVIFVKRTIKTDLEIKFDGVTLFKGFSFIEAGTREKGSTVYCENTIINGAGNATYGSNYAVSDVFSFSNATKTVNTVNIKNTLVTNMSSSNVVGEGVTNFTAENVMFTNSQGGLMGNADALAGQQPNYNITNCMFYNNNATMGVISLDHSLNDNASRTISNVEISECWFIDGPDTKVTTDSVATSPIYATIVGTKNEINVHDCYFEGKTDYTAPVINLSLTAAAKIAELKNKIRFNNNTFIGYTNLPNTDGMTSTSTLEFTGNYYANADFEQMDPVYPSASSLDNVYMEYFYVNEAMTIPSTMFHMKSFGVDGAQIDNQLNTVKATVDFDQKIKVNIKTSDAYTKFKLYDSTKKKEVTVIDASTLESGANKNVFYAVGTNSKYSSYSITYKVYITTFDPAKAINFTKKDTYLLTEDVARLSKGDSYYTVWDGIAYKFTVGKNVFADAVDIFALKTDVPTIIMPAGEYSKDIYVEKSAVILGAKHGINPNIPDFENPDLEWALNPERASSDQETILTNAVIAFEPKDSSSFLTVDGITFGKDSGYADRLATENSYTTSSIENCMVDGAGNAKYFLRDAQTTSTLGSIINVGSSTATEAKTTHKNLRVINIRMVGQPTAILLGTYFETLVMDGCYVANNNSTLFTNEITAPKDQNFYFELRNSCFYKNTTSNYYFIVNNDSSRTTARTSSRLVFDNNTFYETNTNVNGIFGIRFSGATDSLEFTRNNFISSTATAFIPGYENWFIGKSGYKNADPEKDYSLLEPLTPDMIKIYNNRFIGKTGTYTPNTTFTSEQTCLDFSQNYCATSFGKDVKGKKISVTDTKRNRCDSYYSDYAMTDLVDASDEYNTALDYEFYGANTSKRTFADKVTALDATYEFDYDIHTFQAKCQIFTDAACTNEVANPVTLAGGKNVFYVKFSSYDGSVSHTYTATITKPASTGALVEKFGNWQISGKNIFACVPVGKTVFVIPEITVSVGASYKMYNDAACKNEYTDSTITVPSNVPTQKYIKVTSQDAKTVNIYTVTVVQSANDQAELIALQNGTKTDATTFTASTGSSSFDIVAEISDGAKMKVKCDGEWLVDNGDGTFTVENIINTKTVKVVVTSETGVKKAFAVKIVNGSSSAEVESIRNMYTNGGDKSAFEMYTTDPFITVVPTLANGATFALYTDRACKKAVGDTVIIPESHLTTVYMKVVSADKTATNVVKITIKSALIADDSIVNDKKAYVIENGVEVEGATDRYTITTTKNATKYKLNILPAEEANATTTFAVFSDSTYSTRIGEEVAVGTPVEVALDGRNTTVYLRVYCRNGETAIGNQFPVVTIVSARDSVKYSDAGKIAAWAKDEVEFLNKNGYAYFVGDEKGNFNPTSGISRFEVAVVVSKVLGVNADEYAKKRLTGYVDDIPEWARPYVTAVKEMGIMTGKTANTFNGYDQTTRQEFARIISGTIAMAIGETGTLDEIYTNNQALIDYNYSKYTFADQSSVANWAKVGFYLAVAHYDVMSGSADGGKLYLNPTKAITRQEVAVLIANYSGYNG